MVDHKNILIISDSVFPINNSAAKHIDDLARQYQSMGISVTVITPDPTVIETIICESKSYGKNLRIRTFVSKDVNYLRRVLSEIAAPFIMIYRLSLSSLLDGNYRGVIWYSPSIFFGILIWYLKWRCKCKSYLVLRDIFPDWAVDLGIISRFSISYAFLKCFEHLQYLAANKIGVQSPSNLLLPQFKIYYRNKTELLWSWMGDDVGESDSAIPDRILQFISDEGVIFVYTGNIGPAQSILPFLKLAKRTILRKNIRYLFIGRGLDFAKMKARRDEMNLENVMFESEIPKIQLNNILKLVDFGIVSLDINHRTSNIPGKFISYLGFGLPVLAKVNPGNDLVSLINSNLIGECSCTDDEEVLETLVYKMIADAQTDGGRSGRCSTLFKSTFSPVKAANQIWLEFIK
jgi:hypothetical protein